MTFEELLVPNLELAYAVAVNLSKRSEEAENLVQEAAFRALRAFSTFHPGSNFRAWFLRILTNVFYEGCRRQKSQPVLEEQDLDSFFAGKHGDPVEWLFQRLEQEEIRRALVALPEEFRVVAALYFQEELGYQEIADILGAPLGTVRSRLFRARKLLQRDLWQMARGHGLEAKGQA